MEGEACVVVVAQDAGHGLPIHAALQGCVGKGMPQIVEPDVWESGIFQDLLVEVYHGVWMIHFSSDGGGEHIGAVRVLAMLLDQQIYRCLRDGYQPHRVFCLGAGELQGAVRVADILLTDGDFLFRMAKSSHHRATNSPFRRLLTCSRQNIGSRLRALAASR